MKGANRHLENADTAIFLVSHNSELCCAMLKTMRSPGTLSSGASSTFEAAWRLYKDKFADNGGVFGALIHGRLRAVGPVMAMGHCTEAARLAEMLSLKAREITRTTLTPIMTEKALEAAVAGVVAKLAHVEGSA
jgi:hypothetical protein